MRLNTKEGLWTCLTAAVLHGTQYRIFPLIVLNLMYANKADVLWNARALFVSSTAWNGGAIFVKDGATAEWTKQTNFASDIANVNGGTVGSRAPFTHEQDLVSQSRVPPASRRTLAGSTVEAWRWRSR